MTAERMEGSFVPCKGIKTKDWYSWLNLMPPPPDDFHVVGEVYSVCRKFFPQRG
jgi:hypothetical protein